MEKFPVTDKTRITRLPKRGTYDKAAIYPILDEALFCTLSFQRDNLSFQIPTGFCRIDDMLYIHGSVGSSYMRELVEKKLPVSISVTLMDGLVLARSAFHHSVNYRSVSIFSEPVQILDVEEQYKILEVFTNKICPGRWDDVRKPTPNEWKATMVIGFPIQEAVGKIRTGAPKDDEEDYALPVWAGVVPLKITQGTPITDPDMKVEVPLPAYLSRPK